MLPTEITATDAHTLTQNNEPDWLTKARLFAGTHEDLEGDVDHWQDGAGFAGPKPSAEDPARDAYMKQLEKVFIVEDLISEVVGRRRKACLGQPPQVDVKPAEGEGEAQGEDTGEGAEGEKTPAAATAQLLRDWWENQDLTDTLGDAHDRASTEAETLLRLVIDPSRISANGTLQGLSSIEEALRALRVEIIGRDQGLVHEDLRTKIETGVISFSKAEEDGTGEVDYTEKTWRVPPEMEGPTGETMLRIEYEGDSDQEPDEASFDLGGNLLHYELDLELMLSESLRSNQKDLNTKRTMINITGQKAGFPELHLVNITPPEDEDGNEQEPERGPGKIQYHVSVPKEAQGPAGRTETRSGGAEVYETEPVDNASLREDAMVARRSIYRSAQQLHVFLADGDASGRSRQQARHDFVQDAEDVAERLNRAGGWIIETAYALATELFGTSPVGLLPPEEVEPDFACNVDPGPVLPEEQKETRAGYKAGMMSRRTAMLEYGIDDPDAEMERIREEREEEREQGRQFARDVMEGRRQSIEEGAETDGTEADE